MSKIGEIVAIVDGESPGLLEAVSREDGLTKEEIVRKVLALSRGQMVRTHQKAQNCGSGVSSPASSTQKKGKNGV